MSNQTNEDNMSNATITIEIDSRRYEDFDECLSAAIRDYLEDHPEVEEWEVDAHYKDDLRETIILTVPA